MKKKQKNNPEIIQIHGKEECPSKPNTAFSLNELLGENISNYSVKSVDDYLQQLAEMNNTDLHAHAYKIGLVPVPDRKVLCDRLVAEFRKWLSIHVANSNVRAKSGIDSISSKAQKILREGA
jgi:hypothetical protein